MATRELKIYSVMTAMVFELRAEDLQQHGSSALIWALYGA
jgi:hypothetical protein